MTYRALITDLDGTAVTISSDGSDVDEATRQSVARAIAAGKHVACATGREWELAGSVIASLGLTSPCIIDGGTRIVEAVTGETLWEKSLEDGAPNRILQVFKDEASVGGVMHSSNVYPRPLAEETTLPERLRFVYLIGTPEASAQRISERINKGGCGAAHMTPSWAGGGLIDVHVTHPEATKEHAMVVWHTLVGVSKAETIGLGDSGNDVPIFKAAGLKIAVGNATPNLKALADHIVPNVNDSALKYVIDTYLLA